MSPSRAVNGFRAPSAIYSAATDHGELMSLVAGKRRSLLMAGDDDEMYDKKPQRYSEDNRTAFRPLIARSRYYTVEANY